MDKKDINIDDLNDVYRDIAQRINIETAIQIHKHYQGIQIVMPKKLLSKEYVKQCMMEDYRAGVCLKDIARKYDYSERWCRQIINDTD